MTTIADNWTIQVSPKLPDGTLVNVRGTADDLADSLAWVESHSAQIASAVHALTTLGQVPALAGMVAQGGVSVQQSAPPQQQYQQPPQQAAPQQQFPAPACRHGAMQRKEGTNAKGPYSGWVCPSRNRNDQCPAQWDSKR